MVKKRFQGKDNPCFYCIGVTWLIFVGKSSATPNFPLMFNADQMFHSMMPGRDRLRWESLCICNKFLLPLLFFSNLKEIHLIWSTRWDSILEELQISRKYEMNYRCSLNSNKWGHHSYSDFLHKSAQFYIHKPPCVIAFTIDIAWPCKQ